MCDLCQFPKCICIPEDGFATFDPVFNHYKTNDAKQHAKDIFRSLDICTITFCFKYKYTSIDLDVFVTKHKPCFFITDIEYISGNSKNRAKENQMYNTCKFRGYLTNPLTQVCTKMFRNGSFNITGFRNMGQIMSYLHKLDELLKSIDNVFVPRYILEYKTVDYFNIVLFRKLGTLAFNRPKYVRIEYKQLLDLELGKPPIRIEVCKENTIQYIELVKSFDVPNTNCQVYRATIDQIEIFQPKIAMINSDFQFKYGLKMRKTYEYLNAKAFHESIMKGQITQCIFDEDRKNTSIMVKYIPQNRLNERVEMTRKRSIKRRGETTIHIFNTGSVMISGSIHTYDLLETFYFILNVLSVPRELHKDNSNQRRIKRKKVFMDDILLKLQLINAN